MLIKFTNVKHVYNIATPLEEQGLHNINLEISQGEFICIIGSTGSGKSTLLQHMNALLLPTSGEIIFPDGTVNGATKLNSKIIKKIRQKIGLAFQFPEYQLFEETVLKDIMFGPKNYNAIESEAKKAACTAAQLVGLDEFILDKSPFDLSGGQMRRVAIAGILAMNPDILLLDEPTADLDPSGQKEIMDIFINLQQNHNKTIILVTHDMDIVAKYANKIILMNQGTIELQGTPHEVFSQHEVLKNCGILLPTPAKISNEIMSYFNENEHTNLGETPPLTLEEFIEKYKKKS